MLTPYHYTYLNILNGKPENYNQKFEKNNSAATDIKDLFEGSEIQPNGDIK